MTVLMQFSLIMLLAFVVQLWSAFVLSKLWAWFVVAVFSAAPPLSTLHVCGLLLIANLFSRPNTTKADVETDYVVGLKLLGSRACTALIALGFGAAVHRMMSQ
jgi:hypothetical protein